MTFKPNPSSRRFSSSKSAKSISKARWSTVDLSAGIAGRSRAVEQRSLEIGSQEVKLKLEVWG
jgi:hypothetical protein